jgi:hypothetical protein
MAEMMKARFVNEEDKLPEWYSMAKDFFMEIRAYSSSMYEDMNGDSILMQLLFAAEREQKRNEQDLVLQKIAELREQNISNVTGE